MISVLTYSQAHRMPAVLYVCYTDVPYLDIETMKAFKPVLTATPIKDVIEVRNSSVKP